MDSSLKSTIVCSNSFVSINIVYSWVCLSLANIGDYSCSSTSSMAYISWGCLYMSSHGRNKGRNLMDSSLKSTIVCSNSFVSINIVYSWVCLSLANVGDSSTSASSMTNISWGHLSVSSKSRQTGRNIMNRSSEVSI